jgi:hypothetical protein
VAVGCLRRLTQRQKGKKAVNAREEFWAAVIRNVSFGGRAPRGWRGNDRPGRWVELGGATGPITVNPELGPDGQQSCR